MPLEIHCHCGGGPTAKKKRRSGHVGWQPDRVKRSQKRTVFIDIDHNLKQNNQTIKNLRDDRPIGGFEATTAFERGRAEEEEERGLGNAPKRQEMN
jgi:hypothetical protein